MSVNGAPYSKATRKRIGFVLQDDVLYESLTVKVRGGRGSAVTGLEPSMACHHAGRLQHSIMHSECSAVCSAHSEGSEPATAAVAC